MSILLRDDFTGGSLDTSKWGTNPGFSGGAVTVHDGLCELDGGTLNPTYLYSNSQFNRSTLFVSIEITTVVGATFQFGLLNTNILHRLSYSGAYPGSTLYSVNSFGHTAPSDGIVGSFSGLMDASVTVFGMSLHQGASGTFGVQMWQFISSVWEPVGGVAGVPLTPTYDYSVFALVGNAAAMGINWIQLEDTLPSAGGQTYYIPSIQGHPEASSSRLNFSPAKTI